MNGAFGSYTPASSGLRAPRLLVLANGIIVDGAIDAEITSNNHYAADRFRITISVNADPQRNEGLVAAERIQIEVQVSLDGGSTFVSLIIGNVDIITFSPIQGVIFLEGRDLSASLVMAKTQETFSNNTSSEITTILAERHGLQADAQATTAAVGRFWQLEHDRIVLNQYGRATTAWDLLVTLAQHEGFDVWVTGKTLHFREPGTASAPLTILRPRATSNGPANITSLKLDRSLLLAGDIKVIVKSWNSRQGSGCVESASQTGGSGSGHASQTYVYVVPNLMPDDARNYAERRLVELAQHERILNAEMPGELTLAPRMMLSLEGTGTEFDQTYWVDQVDRYISPTQGFNQSIRAKNSSVASQIAPQ